LTDTYKNNNRNKIELVAVVLLVLKIHTTFNAFCTINAFMLNFLKTFYSNGIKGRDTSSSELSSRLASDTDREASS
jgi:hypothetical protein